jgi:hypothetical protein
LIRDGVGALVTMVLLPSSSWHLHPHCNGIIIIINVVALIACFQAGVIALNTESTLPLSQRRLLLLSQWHRRF